MLRGVYFTLEVWSKEATRDDLLGSTRVFVPVPQQSLTVSDTSTELWYDLCKPASASGSVLLRLAWSNPPRPPTATVSPAASMASSVASARSGLAEWGKGSKGHLFRTALPPDLYSELYTEVTPRRPGAAASLLDVPPIYEVLVQQLDEVVYREYGTRGTLYLTNFRVVFVPYARVADQEPARIPSFTDPGHERSKAMVIVPLGAILRCESGDVDLMTTLGSLASEVVSKSTLVEAFTNPANIGRRVKATMDRADQAKSTRSSVVMFLKTARSLVFDGDPKVLNPSRRLERFCGEIVWRCAEGCFAFSICDHIRNATSRPVSHDQCPSPRGGLEIHQTGSSHRMRRRSSIAMVPLAKASGHDVGWRMKEEYQRLLVLAGHPRWTYSDVNVDWDLCPTYPRHLVVPRSLSIAQLTRAAALRSKNRLPVLTWLHPQSGAV